MNNTKKIILASIILLFEALDARLPSSVFCKDGVFYPWGKPSPTPNNEDTEGWPLQHSPFFGYVMDVSGHLVKLRTAGNVLPYWDADGQRDYQRDVGQDGVMRLAICLFPTCADGSGVVISDDERGKFKRNPQKGVTEIVNGLLLIECFRFLQNIAAATGEVYSKESTENKLKILKRIIKFIITIEGPRRNIEPALGESALKKDHVKQTGLYQILEEVGDIVRLRGFGKKGMGSGIGNGSELFWSALEDERECGYAPGTVESVYLGYAGNLLQSVPGGAEKGLQLFRETYGSLRAELFPTAHARSGTDPTLTQYLMPPLDEDARKAIKPLFWFFAYNGDWGYDNPCDQYGRCPVLNRDDIRKLVADILSGTSDRQNPFVDCNETALRHIFMFLMGVRNLSREKIDTAISGIMNRTRDRAIPGSNLDRLRNFLAAHSDNLNDPLREAHVRWNQVVSNLNDPDEPNATKVKYNKPENELQSGFTNLSRAIAKIIGVKLRFPVPLPPPSEVLSELISLFEKIIPENVKLEVHGDLKLDTEVSGEKDYFGTLTVCVVDRETEDMLHEFIIGEKTGHGFVEVKRKGTKDMSELEKQVTEVFSYALPYCVDCWAKKNFFHEIFSLFESEDVPENIYNPNYDPNEAKDKRLREGLEKESASERAELRKQWLCVERAIGGENDKIKAAARRIFLNNLPHFTTLISDANEVDWGMEDLPSTPDMRRITFTQLNESTAEGRAAETEKTLYLPPSVKEWGGNDRLLRMDCSQTKLESVYSTGWMPGSMLILPETVLKLNIIGKYIDEENYPDTLLVSRSSGGSSGQLVPWKDMTLKHLIINMPLGKNFVFPKSLETLHLNKMCGVIYGDLNLSRNQVDNLLIYGDVRGKVICPDTLKKLYIGYSSTITGDLEILHCAHLKSIKCFGEVGFGPVLKLPTGVNELIVGRALEGIRLDPSQCTRLEKVAVGLDGYYQRWIKNEIRRGMLFVDSCGGIGSADFSACTLLTHARIKGNVKGCLKLPASVCMVDIGKSLDRWDSDVTIDDLDVSLCSEMHHFEANGKIGTLRLPPTLTLLGIDRGSILSGDLDLSRMRELKRMWIDGRALCKVTLPPFIENLSFGEEAEVGTMVLADDTREEGSWIGTRDKLELGNTLVTLCLNRKASSMLGTSDFSPLNKLTSMTLNGKYENLTLPPGVKSLTIKEGSILDTMDASPCAELTEIEFAGCARSVILPQSLKKLKVGKNTSIETTVNLSGCPELKVIGPRGFELHEDELGKYFKEGWT